MAVQMNEPAKRLEMLLRPDRPAYPCTPRPDGFRLNRQTDQYELTESGEYHAAIVQRMLLRYVLGYESRAQIGERYGFAARHTQSVINGTTYRWLTAPVRERLLANGVGNPRMSRSPERTNEVRAALEKLAAQAVEYLRWPHLYTYDDKEQVASDLYLISGAWRAEEE